MDPFRNIGIVGREGSGVAETLQRLVNFLQSRSLTVVLGEHIAPLLPNHGLRVSPRKTIGETCDLVIVVGSPNSSNSVRLVEVALEYGAKAAYRVDYASEIEQDWLVGVETIGISSGASVPEILVDHALADLAGAGFSEVEEVRTAEEDLQFSLPKELRRDASGEIDQSTIGGYVRR